MFERFDDPDASLLIRTDFSNDAAWAALCIAVQAPEPNDGFCANFVCIDDPVIGLRSPEDTAAQVYAELHHCAVYFADALALREPDHPILCVSCGESPVSTFRVVADHIWGPENNLRLSNMDFSEFARAVGPNGVFRGF
jgi:hypothetical protein